jgi:hypothetical protein
LDTTLTFFERLHLAPGANARAIRQAYARELKLIDLEANPQAFQALREAYEQVMAELVNDTGSSTMPSHRPSTASSDDAIQAAKSFETLQAALADISGGRSISMESIWQEELRQRVDALRPISIDAQSILEWHIVHLLAAGWRPGHEALLQAAAQSFNWATHRQHLLSLGAAGEMVDRALDEHYMFYHQTETELAPIRSILGKLRLAHEPSMEQLRRNMPHVERMVTRFPTLAPMIVCQEHITRWRFLSRHLEIQSLTSAKPPAPSAAGGLAFHICMLLLVIFRLVQYFF